MKSTLIICALAEELGAVERELQGDFETIEICSELNLKVRLYKTESSEFYTVLSGMGPINAAMRLSLVLAKIKVQRVLLLGVAGGLTSETKMGDLVISSGVIQHDYYSSLESGDFVMKSGELILSAEAAKDHDAFIAADSALIKKCLMTKIQGHQVFEGIVASGSEFVGKAERKIKIAGLRSKLLAVDMEACAVANVCEQFKVPFVVAKTISDTLTSEGSIETDFVKFLNYASQNAAQVVRQFI